MLSLPNELIILILEYTNCHINCHIDCHINCHINCHIDSNINCHIDSNTNSTNKLRYKQLSDIINVWKTCKHFDFLKDKYYTICGKISSYDDNRENSFLYNKKSLDIFTVKLLDHTKYYGHQYGFSTNIFSPDTLYYYRYCVDGTNYHKNEFYDYEEFTFSYISYEVNQLMIINREDYHYHEETYRQIAQQVYKQLSTVDTLMQNWLKSDHHLLIIDIIGPNNYNLIINSSND